MKPMRTIAALAAGAALIWGTAHAAPDTPEAPEGPAAAPEATQEVPVIIMELPPGVAPGSEQEQALITALLMQLMMGGVQIEGGNPDVLPPVAPMTKSGQSI